MNRLDIIKETKKLMDAGKIYESIPAIKIQWWEKVLLWFKRPFGLYDYCPEMGPSKIHFKYLFGRIYIVSEKIDPLDMYKKPREKKK